MIRLYLDTETSGIPRNLPITSEEQPWVAEIALVLTKDFRIIRTAQCLFKPGVSPMNPFAYDAHKMSTEFLQEFGTLKPELFKDLIQDCFTEADQIIGHNLDFDIKMLDIFHGHSDYRTDDPDYICTMKASTEFCALPKTKGTGYKWPKLTELFEKLFDSPYAGAHSALGDTIATMQCHYELIKRGILS